MPRRHAAAKKLTCAAAAGRRLRLIAAAACRTALPPTVECHSRPAMPPFYSVVSLGPLPWRRVTAENSSAPSKSAKSSLRLFHRYLSPSSSLVPSGTSHLTLTCRHTCCCQYVVVSRPHSLHYRGTCTVRLMDEILHHFDRSNFLPPSGGCTPRAPFTLILPGRVRHGWCRISVNHYLPSSRLMICQY